MRYAPSTNRFDYIDRKAARTIVLIPGWASDARIFDGIDLDYNYLIPKKFTHHDFKESLLAAIEDKKIKKVSLFGWSLGGFLAQEFAIDHPGLVDSLIMIGIREKYRTEEISKLRKTLERSKAACLYKFYLQCFHDPGKLSVFKKGLFKNYLNEFSLEGLLDSLEYIGNARPDTEHLKGLREVIMIHGRHDRIAPVEEAIAIAGRMKGAQLRIVENSGHAPFLESSLDKEPL
ncbi:MAG: alpha/beta hydrolase [Candidatus Omnitrophota bacterium]